jgi:transposase-like protein
MPGAMRNFIKNIDLTLSYFSMPERMRSRVRTTNPLNRFFREIRRRTRTMGAFRDRQSAYRILYAIADTYNQKRKENETREHPVKYTQNHFRTSLVA